MKYILYFHVKNRDVTAYRFFEIVIFPLKECSGRWRWVHLQNAQWQVALGALTECAVAGGAGCTYRMRWQVALGALTECGGRWRWAHLQNAQWQVALGALTECAVAGGAGCTYGMQWQVALDRASCRYHSCRAW